jgi:hypothetical protein
VDREVLTDPLLRESNAMNRQQFLKPMMAVFDEIRQD